MFFFQELSYFIISSIMIGLTITMFSEARIFEKQSFAREYLTQFFLFAICLKQQENLHLYSKYLW